LVALVGASGCATGPQRSDARDADLVCEQQHLGGGVAGQITFADIRRTLCYLGRYGGPIDYTPLQRTALAETNRCATAPFPKGAAAEDPPANTLRDLYAVLRARVNAPNMMSGCTEEAMLAGMMRALGPEYGYHPVGVQPTPSSSDSIPTSVVIDQSIVCAKLPGSMQGGYDSVSEALRAARAEHRITGLLLDLRNADGPPLEELARFAGLFLNDGVVLQWRERRTKQLHSLGVRRTVRAETFPVVVLINQDTKSGAEAFAAGLRSRGRALLIGGRTQGVGIVQEMLELPSGSRLAFPVGDLIELGLGPIQGRGVVPDIETASSAQTTLSGEDALVRLGARTLATTRSATRSDLLDAAQRAE
jgi:hypothetical protein